MKSKLVHTASPSQEIVLSRTLLTLAFAALAFFGRNELAFLIMGCLLTPVGLYITYMAMASWKIYEAGFAQAFPFHSTFDKWEDLAGYYLIPSNQTRFLSPNQYIWIRTKDGKEYFKGDNSLADPQAFLEALDGYLKKIDPPS